jgi:hypothetical protein
MNAIETTVVELQGASFTTGAQIGLAAMLVRYLDRRPGRCVFSVDELNEARHLLLSGAIQFEVVDDDALAITFERWPQRVR